MMGAQRSFGMTPWVRRLLVANLLVYLLQLTVFIDPKFLTTFGFAPLTALERPWTFLTYQFLHAGLLHVAFNLLALFVFGPAVEERLGSGTFLAYYLGCGLGGAALSFALMLVLPVHVMVGASAAVYGVMLAYAWFWPDDGVFVFPFPEPIPVKWVVTFAVALSLVLALLSPNDGVAHLAHLGGFGTGAAFLAVRDRRLARGARDAARPQGVLVHPGPRERRATESAPRPPTPPPPDRTQAEIDRVLDKISASGIGSLTPAERRFLAEMSQRLRDRD
jgi:membrane associated rhomboid family serine protease